jgi:RNA polymerase sigma factor (sigma-70 family)
MSYCTTSDSEVADLFRQAQAGEAMSLTRLMRQHDGLVHHTIRRQWCGSLSYAEVLQEGRLGLWRAILGFDPQRGLAFSTYATVAIARHIWRAVAQAEKQTAQEQEESCSELPAAPSPDPLPCLLEQEVKAALHQMVAQLPAKQRWIVRAYYGLDGQGGYTLAQLGHQLGCTHQAVQYHLRQALVRLRHPVFSAGLRALLGRNRRQDYLQALRPERKRS